MTKEFKVRVYYEDTDAAGVVYYANYLKFAERARTEYLRESGFNQIDLAQNQGILFVVKNVTMELLKPAKLDDEIIIKTTTTKNSASSILFTQEFFLNNNLISKAEVLVVCINNNFKPIRIPEFLAL